MCSVDIFALRGFVTTTKQYHNRIIFLYIVDSIARPVINSDFENSFSNRLNISPISK